MGERIKIIFKSTLREMNIKENCTEMAVVLMCEMETKWDYWAQEGNKTKHTWILVLAKEVRNRLQSL